MYAELALENAAIKDVLHRKVAMSEDAYKTSVRLMVFGPDDHASETGRIVGLSPTKTWRMGELVRSDLLLRRKEYCWVLESPAPPGVEPETAIAELRQLVRRPGLFRKLSHPLHVQLAIGVIGRTERPSFHLSAASTLWIGELGAELDVDVYDLS